MTVLGDDLENVLLVGGPTAIARGKVITDDGAPVPSRAIRVAAVAPPGSGRAYTGTAPLDNNQAFEPGQWMDPDFLRSVRDRALRGSIGLGGKKVQNIRMAAAQ